MLVYRDTVSKSKVKVIGQSSRSREVFSGMDASESEVEKTGCGAVAEKQT